MASMTATRTAPKREPGGRIHAVAVASVAGALALAWGWHHRLALDLSPEFGLGYALGIVGTSLMLLLLLYSLRKRVRLLRSCGPIRRWFHAHMVLGIAGPVAIVFHARFDLGSLNSTVALACTLVVAASGLVGRVIYPRIHDVLSGSRLSLAALRGELEARRGALGRALAAAPELEAMLRRFESFALDPRRGAFGRAWRFAVLRRRARATRRRALRATRRGLRRRGAGRAARRETLRVVGDYVDAVARVASFGAWERVFALWHAFHLPLCFLLFLSAAVHVVAVHLY
jgi:hypothetical protein